ncbi:MAG: hypothetical protein V1678_04875 [Candidatus Aenigmatarchaeota archaeon]
MSMLSNFYKNRIRKNKSLIKEAIIFVSILATIFSAFFTIWTYNDQQVKAQESESASIRALLQTLKIEIEYNLNFSTDFEIKKERYKTTEEVLQSRYSTVILEKVINQEIGDENTKKIMMKSYFDMTLNNKILDNFNGFEFFYSQEALDAYKVLKNQSIDVISNNNYFISNELLSLETKFNLSS